MRDIIKKTKKDDQIIRQEKEFNKLKGVYAMTSIVAIVSMVVAILKMMTATSSNQLSTDWPQQVWPVGVIRRRATPDSAHTRL